MDRLHSTSSADFITQNDTRSQLNSLKVFRSRATALEDSERDCNCFDRASGLLLQRISRKIFSAKTAEGRYLIEVLNGISTIKSMGIERTVRWKWEGLFNEYIKKNFSGQLVKERLRLFSNLVEMLMSRILLLFGVWQVIHNQLTIGQLIAFNMLVGNVITPFQRLIALWNDFQEVAIAVDEC